MKQLSVRTLASAVFAIALVACSGDRPSTNEVRQRLTVIQPVEELTTVSTLDLDHFGPWSSRVPIEVPAARGVEPSLALAYSSAAPDGVVGAGWAITGFGAVQRNSGAMGIAEMVATDRFFLDGAELLPCSATSTNAASCRSGGSHYFLDENFHKVRFDDVSWHVWTPDGTEALYTRSPGNSGWRWRLAKVSDRNGNRAEYSTSDRGGTEYLDSISYGFDGAGAAHFQIIFSYEARPDPLTRGSRDGLVTIGERLTSVAVFSESQLVRAYNLGYEAAGSFVSSIQPFASTATRNPLDGRYAGASLPAVTYQRGVPFTGGFDDTFKITTTLPAPAREGTADDELAFTLKDAVKNVGVGAKVSITTVSANRDGVPDFAVAVKPLLSIAPNPPPTFTELRSGIMPRTIATGITPIVAPVTTPSIALGSAILRPDFDGDGLSDLMAIDRQNVLVARGQPDGTLAFTTLGPIAVPQLAASDNRPLVGDFDGDGRPDVLVYSRRKQTMSNAGTTTPCQADTWSCDLNGERFVLLRVDAAGTLTAETFTAPITSRFVQDRLSTTLQVPYPVLGFVPSGSTETVLPYPEWASADLDGDRVPELISVEAIYNANSFTHVDLRITPNFVRESGAGLGLVPAPPLVITNWALIDGPIEQGISLFINPGDLTGRLMWGELNGDGRQDLLLQRVTDRVTHTEHATTDTELSLTAYYAKGDGTFVAGPTARPAGVLPEMIDTYRQSALGFLPCGGSDQCSAEHQAQLDAYTVLQADLNADGIDDLFVAEEDIGLGFIAPGYPNPLQADVRTWTLIWGANGIAEERGNVWGTAAAPVATYALRVQAMRPFVDAKFGWVIADFNVDGVSDIGWVDFAGASDATVRVFPQTPRVDTPLAARWADISGEGHTDVVRIGPLQTEITSAVRTATGTTIVTAPVSTGRADELVSGDFGSLGDARADGRTDFAWVSPDGGGFPGTTTAIRIAYARGDGNFDVLATTVTGVPFVGDRWSAVDLDGDHTDEIVQVLSEGTNTTVRTMRRSTATAWVDASSPAILVSTEPSFGAGRWQPAHLGGGERTDFLRITPGRSATPDGIVVDTLVQSSTGGWSFDSTTIATSALAGAVSGGVAPSRIGRAGLQVGDLNSDGITDLVRISRTADHQAGTLVVTALVGSGKPGAARYAADGYLVTAPTTGSDAELSSGNWMWTDLDSDGASDAVQVTRGFGAAHLYDYVHLLHGKGARAASWDRHQLVGAHADTFHFRNDTSAWVLADFLAPPLGHVSDGQVDLVRPVAPVIAPGTMPTGAMGIEAYAVDLPRPVMRTELSGYGLKTEMTYATSKGRHDGVPIGGGEYNLAKLHRLVAPSGDESVVDFSYESFRYDHATRRSLGYAAATATSIALAGGAVPKLTVAMSQDPICAGRRTVQDRGVVRQRTEYERSTANGNRLCVVASEMTTHVEYGGTPVATQVRYVRDDYGSVSEIWDDGNFVDSNHDRIDDDTGDNRHTTITFVRNPAAYLMSFPSTAARYDHANVQLGAERFAYDGQAFGAMPTQGNTSRREEWDDVHAVWQRTTSTFWPGGAPRTVTNPTGVSEETTYDPTLTLYPEQRCNAKFCGTQTWNKRFGKIASSTDRNGETTTYTYDLFGRLTRTEFEDGACLMHTWGDLGDPKRQWSFEGVCRTPHEEPSIGSSLGVVTYFDGMTRPWRQVRQGTYEKLTTYWGTTTLVQGSEDWHDLGAAGAVTNLYYEILGRPVRTVNPDRSERLVGYTPGQVATQDENNNAHLFEYDARGNLVVAHEYDAAAGGLSQAARYEYDAADRVTAAIDDAGNQSTTTYSSLGWTRQSCDPDRGCIDYEYNAAGQVVTITDSRGTPQWLSYDVLGRLELRTTKRPAGVVELEHRYWDIDPTTGLPSGSSWGRPVKIVDEAGSTSYEYDNRGRPALVNRCTTSPSATACAAWQTTYNLVGRIDELVYPDKTGQLTSMSERVRYGYDDYGRTDHIESALGVYLDKAAYDANDRRVFGLFGNGVEEQRGYDPDRAWLKDVSVHPTSGTGLALGYEYDTAGRPTRFSWTDASSHELLFDYDTLDRLTEIRGELGIRYMYDELGRITFNSAIGSYRYRGASTHAVTDAGPMTLKYDAAGNAQRIDRNHYEWNEDGLLVHGTTAVGDLDFGYNADGERVFKEVAGRPTFYFGGLAERDAQGDLKYFYKLGDQVIAQREGGAAQWLHTDLLGSVRAISNSSGAITDQYDYAPFGAKYRVGAQAPPFGFTGQRFDDETGLSLLGARYYHPELGRFISADSIIPSAKNPQSHDRYAYAYNSPTRLIDPSGHAPIEANSAQQAEIRSKDAEKPEQEPLHEYCRTHPGDARCTGPGGPPQPVDVKKVDPQLAAIAIHNRQTKGGQDAAEEWTLTSAFVSAKTKLINLLNEGTWTEQAAYRMGEHTGFNSLTRAGTGEDVLSNPLSIEERVDQAIEGGVKVVETGVEIATVVELGTAMLGRRAAGAAVESAETIVTKCEGGSCSCFAAGTPVMTAERGPQPIETIQAGDLVLAFDPATGTTAPRAVVQTFAHNNATLELDLLTDDGTESALHVTAEHPFLTCDGGFVGAGELEAGACVTTATGAARVTHVREPDRTEPVFNFEVEVDHTYLVGDGLYVVHNVCDIYLVDGAKTPSGKPYVGSANDLGVRAKTARDGRDRAGAAVTDNFAAGNRLDRRIREQQAINDAGGLKVLDNKRNEVAERFWQQHGITPP